MAVLDFPILEDYGLSRTLGFLGPAQQQLLHDKYKPWQSLLSELPQLIAEGRISKAIESLPLLDTDQLYTDSDLHRSYVCLAFLIHGYVWGSNAATTKQPKEVIPPQLAEPFLDVCSRIGTEPVLSYSGLCLWNWIGDPSSLEDLQTLGSFTGTRGEAAFYLVPVLIEAEGGPLIPLLLDALKLASSGNCGHLKAALEQTTDALDRMSKHLQKLYAVLDASMFYFELRPFLAGGKGAAEKGLPRGMVFQRSDGSQLEAQCVGGSAVQSSLFPFLDIVLGVSHQKPDNGSPSLFQEMRRYMPGKHRQFLERAESLRSIRSFVEERLFDTELNDAFNACLDKLRSWRGKHIAVVSKYIVQPARTEASADADIIGTGGSSLIPFLRQSKDETRGITNHTSL